MTALDIETAQAVAAEFWIDVDMRSARIVNISNLPADLEAHYSRGKSGREWVKCPVIHYGRFRMFYDAGLHELNVSMING